MAMIFESVFRAIHEVPVIGRKLLDDHVVNLNQLNPSIYVKNPAVKINVFALCSEVKSVNKAGEFFLDIFFTTPDDGLSTPSDILIYRCSSCYLFRFDVCLEVLSEFYSQASEFEL